jgi:hypothetical protein
MNDGYIGLHITYERRTNTDEETRNEEEKMKTKLWGRNEMRKRKSMKKGGRMKR